MNTVALGHRRGVCARMRCAAAFALLASLLVAAAPSVAAEVGDPPDYQILRAASAPPATTGRALPKYRFLFGEPVKWQQPLHWRYNHSGAPAALGGDKAAVLREMQATLDQWTGVCGVRHVYDGETTTPPNRRVDDPALGELPDGENVIGWGPLPGGTAGLTYAWYRTEPDGRRAFIDADIVLSPVFATSATQIVRSTAHEWGHALGLAHSDAFDALMSGPPETTYNMLIQPADDDIRGCRCLYGPAAAHPAGYSCSLPKTLSLGDVPVGVPTTRTLAFTNDGNAVLTISAVAGATAELSAAGCAPGLSLAAGEACTLAVTARFASTGARAFRLEIVASDGRYPLPVVASAVAGSGVGATVEVIEYHRADIDHYFMSSLAAESDALGSGRFKGWARTGRAFSAYASAQADTSPVCRFYLPPAYGDSHFYGRDPQECDAVRAANPGFAFEAPDVMHLTLPVAGVCPNATVAVYRVFNARVDTNHRYMTDPALRDAMVARGWVAEGEGPDVVTMCAPH
jgi:hypothetical protein